MQGVTSFCPTTLPPLSFFWRNHLDLGREPLMRRQIYRPVLHLGARRVFPKEIVIVPIHRRSNRSRDEPAAAIRANISQNAFDAGGTKGTLIGADTRLKRIRRQRLVAMLAGRFEFKHGDLVVKLSNGAINGSWNISLVVNLFSHDFAKKCATQPYAQTLRE